MFSEHMLSAHRSLHASECQAVTWSIVGPGKYCDFSAGAKKHLGSELFVWQCQAEVIGDSSCGLPMFSSADDCVCVLDGLPFRLVLITRSVLHQMALGLAVVRAGTHSETTTTDRTTLRVIRRLGGRVRRATFLNATFS